MRFQRRRWNWRRNTGSNRWKWWKWTWKRSWIRIHSGRITVSLKTGWLTMCAAIRSPRWELLSPSLSKSGSCFPILLFFAFVLSFSLIFGVSFAFSLSPINPGSFQFSAQLVNHLNYFAIAMWDSHLMLFVSIHVHKSLFLGISGNELKLMLPFLGSLRTCNRTGDFIFNFNKIRNNK